MSQPKFKKAPPHRQPTNICDPTSFDRMQLRIQFDLLDFEHAQWGWENLTKDQFVNFLKFVRGLERLSWAEIKTTGGGKTKGTNHHSIELHKFTKKVQDRLKHLNLHTLIGDSLFSLRICNIVRIYGVRENQYFRPIWYDPFHDQHDKAVYPLKK
jgi:hypothetical protein